MSVIFCRQSKAVCSGTNTIGADSWHRRHRQPPIAPNGFQTIRRGHFGAKYNINFTTNPVHLAYITETFFGKSRFYVSRPSIFSSIPFLFQQYIFINQLHYSNIIFINPASIDENIVEMDAELMKKLSIYT